MIVVPPKTLDFECSAPVEDLPVWGAVSDAFTTVRSGFYATGVWENPLTQDLYAIVSSPQKNAIYRKLKAEGFFTTIKTFADFTTNGFSGISGDAALGLVYVWGTDNLDADYLFSYNLATGNDTELFYTPAGTRLQGFATNTVDHSLYLYDTEIKVRLYGGAAFTSFSTEFPDGIESMAINSITGDFYVSSEDALAAHSVVFKRSPEDTTFTEITDLGTGMGLKLFVDTLTNDVFARRSTDLYKQTGGVGAFVDLGISPGITVHEVSNVTGRLYGRFSYDLVYYSQNRWFQRDEYCRDTTNIYLSLVDENASRPGTDATKWFDYTPVNNRRAFDGGLTSVTESGDSDLHFTLMGEFVDSVGLFNVRGVQATLRILTPSGVFYEESKTISGRNMAFLDLPDPGSIAVYAFVILAGSAGVYCGGVVGGVAQDIGRTGWGVNVELVSYSKVSLDDFGRATLNQRGRAKRVTFPVHAELSQAQDIYNIFNENDAAFCMWQGDATSDFLLVYGIYKRLDLPLKQTSVLQYSFEVLGDVDTPVTEGEFTLATPAASIEPTRAVIAEDGRTVFVWLTGPAGIGADGTGGFVLTVTDGPVYPLSYVAGAGGICLVLTTAEVVTGTPLNLSYTQPGAGFVPLDSFSMFTVSSYLFLSDVEEVADAIHTLLHTTLPETMGVEIWQ